jgi:hypothetical protein
MFISLRQKNLMEFCTGVWDFSSIFKPLFALKTKSKIIQSHIILLESDPVSVFYVLCIFVKDIP